MYRLAEVGDAVLKEDMEGIVLLNKNHSTAADESWSERMEFMRSLRMVSTLWTGPVGTYTLSLYLLRYVHIA